MFKKIFFIVFLVLFLALPVGCEPEAPEEPVDEPENVMGYVDQPLTADGSSDGYPSDPIEEAGAVIYLAYDEEFIYVHLVAEVDGWVSVGFNRSGGGMDGANMIIGYLAENETPAFRDDVGSGHSHSEAGVAAVEDFYLDRSEGATVIEFSYPVTFPAEEGYAVEEIMSGETYSLIIAMHESSDLIDTKHSTRGSADFQVQP